MHNDYKEVYFDQYCSKCKHKTVPENNEPCAECLDTPINLESHKPVNYEQK